MTWWSYPTLAVITVLSGLLLDTYVRPGGGIVVDTQDRPARRGALSGIVSLFAVGCPVCNKLVLIALRSSGATTWFAPAQPLLAAASIPGLAWRCAAGGVAPPAPPPRAAHHADRVSASRVAASTGAQHQRRTRT